MRDRSADLEAFLTADPDMPAWGVDIILTAYREILRGATYGKKARQLLPPHIADPILEAKLTNEQIARLERKDELRRRSAEVEQRRGEQ